LQRYWGKLRDVQTKSYKGDLVTEADKESEAAIMDHLQARYPEHSYLGEETGGKGEQREAGYLWAIDPLDGTTNYTHQYPQVCVSIGLIESGQATVGVVYNPILEELFEGGKGLGVRLNGKAVSVSSVPRLDEGLLVTGFCYDRRQTNDNNVAEFCHLVMSAQGVRRAGAAALDLAQLAAGRLDAYWERGLNPWDIAAGVALIEEAGGRVSDYDLGGLDLYGPRIMASNGCVHEELSRELLFIRERGLAHYLER
jgi:myo-inositol-1(or 4)-monophosphatase